MTFANHNFNNAAAKRSWQKDFNKAFDILCNSIDFTTEEQAIRPHNVEKTKEAFNKFCDDLGWPLAKICFDELLTEKSGPREFRADGRTPNWYHEFRESLWFLSFVRSGLIKEADIAAFGGTEVAICSILRHDSWEDLGKDRDAILEPLMSKIGTLMSKGFINTDEYVLMGQKAELVADNVDYLTSKIPARDQHGEIILKPNGNYLKIPRFEGQLNLYYDHVLKSPISIIAKFLDSIEGMSTRIGVASWTVDDDRKYTQERRSIFGARSLDVEAKEKYSFIEKAIETADSMLGIHLNWMELFNAHHIDGGQHPKYARPFRIEEYEKTAPRGFDRLPPAWHPVCIHLERLENKAKNEVYNGQEARTRLFIENSVLPTLQYVFPKITAYRGSTPDVYRWYSHNDPDYVHLSKQYPHP